VKAPNYSGYGCVIMTHWGILPHFNLVCEARRCIGVDVNVYTMVRYGNIMKFVKSPCFGAFLACKKHKVSCVAAGQFVAQAVLEWYYSGVARQFDGAGQISETDGMKR